MAGFSRDMRIRRRAEFQHVYEHGARVHGPYFTLFVLQSAGHQPGAAEKEPKEPEQKHPDVPAMASRLGIAATKKLGGAVVRNRAKRLIREVFRRTEIAPGFDVVIVPKRECLQASLTTLDAEYRATIERTLRRFRPSQNDARTAERTRPA